MALSSPSDRGAVLHLLYRGRLHSCNYACEYCPFAKSSDSRESLQQDAAELARFVRWVSEQRARPLAILFTPWGEALIRRHYREAMLQLAEMGHVQRVAAQTNLSCELDWLERADATRLALWCTYHPSQVSRASFLAACARLDRIGIRYSVGMVGLREDFAEIAALRAELPAHVYLWINAYKREPGYYASDELVQLEAIDPLFRVNLRDHPSLGHACGAGHDAISVLGDGTVRRCHFIEEPIGNLYDPAFMGQLYPRPCTRPTCRCHIGYVHMPELGLREVFHNGVLERIPARLPVVR